MKKIVQLILALVIVGLVYVIYDQISTPIRFENVKKAKEEAVIERIKDIRTAERAFKSKYQHFTGDFDTLINFVLNDSIEGQRRIVDEDDSVAMAQLKKSRQEKYRNLHGSRYRHDLRTEEAFARSGEEFPLHTGNEQAGRIHDRSRHGYDRVEGRRSGRRGQGPLREVPRYGYVPSGSDQPHQGSGGRRLRQVSRNQVRFDGGCEQ